MYAYSSLRIQLQYEWYAEGMYDTYAYSSFEHIDRNIVIKRSGFDYDWTLLLSVSEVCLNVFLSTDWSVFFTHKM